MRGFTPGPLSATYAHKVAIATALIFNKAEKFSLNAMIINNQ